MNAKVTAAYAVGALLLTGCSGGGDSGESSSTAPATVTVTASSSTPPAMSLDPTEDSIPASSTNPAAFGTDEAFAISDPQFIAKARLEVGEGPTDAQLRSLGQAICKDLDGGTRVEREILALTGGQVGGESMSQDQIAYLVGISVRAYCPQYEGEVRALAVDNTRVQ